MTANSSSQQTHLNQARASLSQALSWYGNSRRHGKSFPNSELQAAVKEDLQIIKAAYEKLDETVIRIATFGLVSRGKSAVVNALVGKKVMTTGPVNGVTRWPQTIRWTPSSGKVQIELIDTPGLDEVEGEERAAMARTIAQQADLILFIVAGDITRTEYRGLCELREAKKPILLVFNKVDLYPDKDRQVIYQQLRELGTGKEKDELTELLSPQEIVMVSAEPSPLYVRVEQANGEISYEREEQPPQVEALKEAILNILNREGRSLLALNALLQAQTAENHIATETMRLRQEDAETLIWNYTRYKAIAVAVNPIAIFDLIGGTVADLALIRGLARLYGLPMTSYEAGKLWRRILISSGSLLLGEMGTGALLGLGKSGAMIGSGFGTPVAIASYAGLAATQGAIAGFGAYSVGKVAQEYLKQGCSWGPLGPSTVIKDILSQVEGDTIIYRLKQELISWV
ncbi:UNVERIFIED_CONTAM: GTPase [Euhalothece sp. KZN 001]